MVRGLSRKTAALITASIVVTVTVFSLAPLLVLGDTEQNSSETSSTSREAEPAQLAPSRYSEAEARTKAALADLSAEEMRLSQAASDFGTQMASNPDTPFEYVLSFGTPIRALDLLAGIEAADDVNLQSVFIWLEAPGSVSPITGKYSSEDFGWPEQPPEIASDLISQHALFALQNQLAAVKTARDEEAADGEGTDELDKQISELTYLESAIRSSGVMLYGMQCVCSPTSVELLTSLVPGFVLRAAELQSSYEFPIWPRDALRDAIIETGGRYGR